MSAPRVAEAEIRRWLSDVPDPEIPAISLVDLGVIRDIGYAGDVLVVGVAPTYTGCPATAAIALSIEEVLRAHGVADFRIERRLSPPWTTDWISDEGREKLRAYGVAPPSGKAAALAGRLRRGAAAVECPRCGSAQTSEISRFGSTPCKAQYRCDACLEPFDYFKCI